MDTLPHSKWENMTWELHGFRLSHISGSEPSQLRDAVPALHELAMPTSHQTWEPSHRWEELLKWEGREQSSWRAPQKGGWHQNMAWKSSHLPYFMPAGERSDYIFILFYEKMTYLSKRVLRSAFRLFSGCVFFFFFLISCLFLPYLEWVGPSL